MNEPNEALAITMQALDRIIARLSLTLMHDTHYFPIAAKAIASENSDVLRVRDAFLQRFEQTADHILRKLHPRLLSAIDAEIVAIPFFDILDRLHRLDIIDNPIEWVDLNRLRNRLVHEYSLTPTELSADLNAAWAAAPMLIKHVNRVRLYIASNRIAP